MTGTDLTQANLSQNSPRACPPHHFVTGTDLTQANLSQNSPHRQTGTPAHLHQHHLLDHLRVLLQETLERQQLQRDALDVIQAIHPEYHAPPVEGRLELTQPRLVQSKRLVIESRWVSKVLSFAGKLRPRPPNN
eukprot:COSAG01_NODE_8866_length_2631_cov_129.957741_2_plen_134_part_00